MKSNAMPSIVQIEAEELKQLVCEVKETVATEHVIETGKAPNFGAADLWNVQKRMKPALREKLTRRWGM